MRTVMRVFKEKVMSLCASESRVEESKVEVRGIDTKIDVKLPKK